MTTVDFITLGVAVLGATLGVLNTWRSFSLDRVRIQIIPKWAYAVGSGPLSESEMLSLDIVNLSQFPVTVATVGLRIKGRKEVAAIVNPLMFDGGKLPRRLEARESFSVFCTSDVFEDAKLRGVKDAFVTTSCGRTAYGRGPVLKRLGKGGIVTKGTVND